MDDDDVDDDVDDDDVDKMRGRSEKCVSICSLCVCIVYVH